MAIKFHNLKSQSCMNVGFQHALICIYSCTSQVFVNTVEEFFPLVPYGELQP